MSDDKPFVCTYQDCTMAFTNEDHLEVHVKKHKMALNLGTDNLNITMDQTPTPTRFIRNCEEVGLFQDLQNVNPFDETFRKATELVKTGTLHLPAAASDDSLHTPHFSPSIDSLTIPKFNRNNSDNLEIKENNLLDFPEFQNKCTDVLNESFDIEKNAAAKNQIVSENGSKIIRQNSHSKLTFSRKSNVLAKRKLHQTLILEKRLAGSELNLENSETNLSLNKGSIESDNKNKVVSKKKQVTKNKRDIKTANQTRRERQKEINRVAQTKYRRKKKFWNVHLQEQVKDLQKDKEKYVKENENFKREISLLKSILSYHEDCSASKNPNTVEAIKLLRRESRNASKKLSKKSTTMSPQSSKLVKKIVPIAPNNSSLITLTPIANAVLIPISLGETKSVQSVPLACSTSNTFLKINNGFVENLLSVNSKNLKAPNLLSKESKSVLNLNCVQNNEK